MGSGDGSTFFKKGQKTQKSGGTREVPSVPMNDIPSMARSPVIGFGSMRGNPTVIERSKACVPVSIADTARCSHARAGDYMLKFREWIRTINDYLLRSWDALLGSTENGDCGRRERQWWKSLRRGVFGLKRVHQASRCSGPSEAVKSESEGSSWKEEVKEEGDVGERKKEIGYLIRASESAVSTIDTVLY
ncbi:hypothetical protein K438DRAFT_1779994 [Mycena galopus ATCC 62051]|nr:hypothetical protein K438DRAFT_1779994 [Mycena galopus ATCC 62051]